MTRAKLVWFLAFLQGLVCPLEARASQLLSQAEAAAQLRFLASDELAGRLTGTPGNHAAARYIAESLRSYGVSKPEGWSDYLQPVPLVRIGPPTLQHLAINGRELLPGADFAVISGTPAEFKGPARAAGHGRSDDEGEDYKGVDVNNRAALVRFGIPGRRPSGRVLAEKNATAARYGAAALIEFYDGPDWDRVADFLGGSRIQLADSATPAGIPHIVVRGSADLRFEELAAENDLEIELSVGPRSEESVSSANVVGVVAGADSSLKSECVVVMAHFDHVGSGMGLRGATERDSIFNGARDNGMGVVALLAAAKRIAARPAKRTVVFVATTAEEQGLLGSSHYVRHPVRPLAKTAFALNSDGAGFNDTGVATVLGLDRTGAKRAIEEGAAQAGLKAIPGPESAADLFERSDNAVFAREGVPSVTFSPGFRNLGGEIMRYYHQPSDEADDDFDYAYLVRFAEAFANAAAEIADSPQAPRWSAGDPYEAAFEQLHGPR